MAWYLCACSTLVTVTLNGEPHASRMLPPAARKMLVLLTVNGLLSLT